MERDKDAYWSHVIIDFQDSKEEHIRMFLTLMDTIDSDFPYIQDDEHRMIGYCKKCGGLEWTGPKFDPNFKEASCTAWWGLKELKEFAKMCRVQIKFTKVAPKCNGEVVKVESYGKVLQVYNEGGLENASGEPEQQQERQAAPGGLGNLEVQ